MVNGEQTLNAPRTQTWSDKVCRSIMLKIFASLPQGQLVIKEKGVLIDTFGERNSDLHAEIDINDLSTYKRLLFGGSVASGETYTEGLWTTPNLTNVIRIFARNLDMLDAWEAKMEWLALPLRKIKHIANKNSHSGAKKNIAAHYDLGNKLYTRFLDNSMMYSSAIYPQADASLEQAQHNKLKVICDKLQLTENDHLLEIGTGWGGLAVFAAKHYGCNVTTTTISEEQHAYANEWIIKEGLQEKVTLLKQDYRLLEGQYDKLVSIEMIEAVGKEFLPTFFKKCSSLLKKQGVMLLQAITINDQRLESYSKNVDFIQKHIFPGGYLPSQLLINQHLKRYTDLMIRDLHDIGLDYAKTLQDWHHRLLENRDVLANDGYDERFMKMWRYYFSYCEGGFLERTISTVQLVVSKPAFSAPLAR
ncbi:MAG: cyclopropane-fatty-acyl-phospholipid synthase family protein [Paraglaciecola sp.]|uniref:SAM-dependent methyltransferase n=1 Tax=Paraglaciecola sp. TaxID=1920173 RepID=UPI00273DED9B|nr:cyclopropane-fatty-acyl-phospholipid synthase family protein [Paraglaciecola sp.]MDP5032437.1 cyclopropane-fatty-acyl-phospholipid synthase family protein [Paraglaciecola sp.]MDP5130657.1 cyclopropane-fatty-acyl-phospholipid synthase family protein [Paraglaciecola sp.]